MKILIDATQLALDKELNKMVETTKKGAQEAAETIRDEARDNYVKMVHRTEYGKHSAINAATSQRSLKHAIVVRPNRSRTEFLVAPKKGGMNTGTKVTSYEDILGFIHDGTGKTSGKAWTFKLPWGRTTASPTGYWTTRGHKPKPFMVETSKRVDTNQWNRVVEVSVTERLRKEFK